MAVLAMDRTIEKAKIFYEDDSGSNHIEVMFNPNEYTVSYEAKYNGENDKKQFKITQMPEFKVSLFYDTYEKNGTGEDVRKETNKIVLLMKPSSSKKKTKLPPECVFSWGLFNYRGVVTRVDQRFTMFLGNGIPVRAIVDVTFTSNLLDKEVDVFKGLEACRKLWTVKSGERLDLIANAALKDPLKWRKIAEANNIVNPVGFPGSDDIGRILLIPD
ncbi:MAG: peptidoglycan-binding protein LysM [Bacillota bacterium]|nr:peptidoglycan-binding protein LysM [Bacillota bacterium]